MKVFHRSMQTKLPELFPRDEGLDWENLETQWTRETPALVVIHGEGDAETALGGWDREVAEGRLSMLVVSSEGFGGRRDLPSAAHPCVHWLSWGIRNLGDGGPSGWQKRKMEQFLAHVEGLERNPPDWKLLELPAMPKHLLAGYVLTKARIEGREEILEQWKGPAAAELADLQRREPEEEFRWKEATIEGILKGCGWLDDG